MADITRSIRKYAGAYREYPSRILEYSPSILVHILRICRVLASIRLLIRRVSYVFSRILAYSRVFVAYPRICVFLRILVYSRVF